MAMNKRAIQEGDEWARIYEFNIAVRVPPGSWLCLNVAQADTHAHYHTTLSPGAITVAVPSPWLQQSRLGPPGATLTSNHESDALARKRVGCRTIQRLQRR